MPALAFMSFGGALLAMMALTAVVTAYIMLLGLWWRTRATWAGFVLLVVPVLLTLWVWWDLRQGRRITKDDE